MIPGMKEVRDNVLLSLGALALLALFLYLGQSGGWDFKLGLMAVVSFGAAVFFVWEAYMEARGVLRSKKEREQWNVPTQVALEMPYAKAMKEVAKEFNAPCIDLFAEQKKAMELIGEEECAKFYCIQRKTDRYDPSHTNLAGAHFVANIIATELAKADTPLAKEVNSKRLWQYKLVPKIKSTELNTER